MNINWHIVNEVFQWLVLIRIWFAICNNNTKIMNMFNRVDGTINTIKKY